MLLWELLVSEIPITKDFARIGKEINKLVVEVSVLELWYLHSNLKWYAKNPLHPQEERMGRLFLSLKSSFRTNPAVVDGMSLIHKTTLHAILTIVDFSNDYCAVNLC